MSYNFAVAWDVKREAHLGAGQGTRVLRVPACVSQGQEATPKG